MMCSSVMSAPATSPLISPSLITEHAIAHTDELGQFGRDDDESDAFAGELTQDAVDLGFGADVDATRRLIQEDHLRLDRQQLREGDLLLVTSRQRRHAVVDVAALEP